MQDDDETTVDIGMIRMLCGQESIQVVLRLWIKLQQDRQPQSY